jgi:hypothetical protein
VAFPDASRYDHLDVAQHLVEAVGQPIGHKVGFHGHHAAADVHTDSGGDDGALGRDH